MDDRINAFHQGAFQCSARRKYIQNFLCFQIRKWNTKGTISPGDYGWGSVTSNLDIYVNLNVENYIVITEPIYDGDLIQPGESVKIKGEASFTCILHEVVD
jgi:hypothetical protein